MNDEVTYKIARDLFNVNSYAWIDGQRLENDYNVWKTHTGDLLTYFSWANNQPDFTDNRQSCLMIQFWGNGLVHDWWCDNDLPSICQMPDSGRSKNNFCKQ